MTHPAISSPFKGKRAIVTGGAQGIGKAIVAKLAAGGATVGLFDIDAARAESAARQLQSEQAVRDAGGRVLAYQADVTDEAATQRAVEAFVGVAGGVDILVNNAGITRDDLFFRMDRESWDAVLTTNLTSMYVVTRAVQSYMVQQQYGRIISLSSRSALGNRGQANYAAAKAGVQGFTATLAIELGPFNITANAVAPGFIATDMTDATARRVGRDPEEYRAEIAERTPLRRVGKPEEVADAVLFFASDASSYVSGQTLYINGGAR